MSVFDTVVKTVVGDIADDAADSGKPIKIGGKALSARRTAVANNDRVNATFDLYGRQLVRVDAVSIGYTPVSVTPADPTASGASDLVTAAGAALTAADFTIRDTTAHRFAIPMYVPYNSSGAGARSCTIYMKNNASTAWNQTPTITVRGHVSGGGGYQVQLATWVAPVTANYRWMIGPGAVGLGGLVGASPTAGTFYWYQVDAIATAPWFYIEVEIKFSVAPTAGELAEFLVLRA